MAELILGSVVSSITEQATSLISREIGGALGAKDELKKLWDTVQAIKAVLAEAERRQVQDKAIRDWLKKVSGAVYEADDLLDDYSTEIKRRRLMEGNPNNRMMKELRTFFSSFNRVLYNFKMADRVKSIRETLNTINQNKEKYNLGEDNTGNAPHNQIRDYMEKKKERDDDPYFCQSHLFGRDDDSKKICTRLFNDSTSDENVSVIPIIGIGGLGKTALAKQIYNDEKVDKHFSLKFWVCVSHNFDEKIILKKILQQYVQQCDGIKKVEEDCRADELRKKIEGKKYLLVLDDVWNENRGIWLNLENYLKNGARGSKILVTARSESVVKIMTRDIPYRLEGLSMENSLALLMKMAHKKEDEWKNQILEEIGREIVSKCGKVPLAIMTIGRLLCYKYTEKDWEIFNSQEFAGIKQETDDILPTLKLSYDILPSSNALLIVAYFPRTMSLAQLS
ncbi:hypothetical protein SAY87_006460 [Trapa incisa]|uniref:RPW8 domain-containing protein n=1 Tax=Trapa incisa TaxID=236973 RepID=A0AAN7PZ87_9MYRT|nr:hypothetical protein SAY87_006460 [Trapa incisa]